MVENIRRPSKIVGVDGVNLISPITQHGEFRKMLTVVVENNENMTCLDSKLISYIISFGWQKTPHSRVLCKNNNKGK